MTVFDDALTLDLIRDRPDRTARACLVLARQLAGGLWLYLYEDTSGVYDLLTRGHPTWMADLASLDDAISRVFHVLNARPEDA